MSQIVAEHVAERRVTLPALFCEFLKLSLCSFGGGLVWARRFIVDQRHWISEHEFADILSVCQLMPGPNVIGMAVCIGAKLRGPIGAVAAVAGFVLVPCAIGLPLGAMYLNCAHSAVVHNILAGVSAVAAGLLIATGVRMLRPHRGRPTALLFVALTVAGMAIAKMPLILVLLVLAPFSIVVARGKTTRSAG